MGFFEHHPAPHEHHARQRDDVQPVWMRREGVLPGTVGCDLVLAHTDAVAVAVSGLFGYPNGFEFRVHVLLREPDLDITRPGSRSHFPASGAPLPPEMLRLGLQFSDGTKLTNLPHPFPATTSRPVMVQFGGTIDERNHRLRYWVWPLPPPGPLTFVCEWPHYRIGETRAEIDAQVVLEAAGRAVTLWPESP